MHVESFKLLCYCQVFGCVCALILLLAVTPDFLLLVSFPQCVMLFLVGVLLALKYGDFLQSSLVFASNWPECTHIVSLISRSLHM